MSATLKVIAAAALLPLPAAAENANSNPCMQRDAIVTALTDRYAEAPVGIGLQDERAVIEIFRSEGGESWTILQSFPNGVSCVVASGTDWMTRDPMELAGIRG